MDTEKNKMFSKIDFLTQKVANISSEDLTPRDHQVYQIGHVKKVSDGVAEVTGLGQAMMNEMLRFENGEVGLVLSLQTNYIGVVILGPYEKIQEGEKVYRTNSLLHVPVGRSIIGRTLNSLGHPVDGKGELKTDAYLPVEREAPDVMARQAVKEPLLTGQIAIDALVPIGRGQRELIIGDRKTGKTTIALDTILNQKGKDVICFYVAIGQKESTVRAVIEVLKRYEAMDYTCIVTATASEPTAMQYICPYAACAMAEYFMYRGKDVLIVYDDLSKHAIAYRELSLLLRRPPGREAYPGDVFYLHSRLLERSAKLSEEEGGGSLTALPIIETQFSDVSAYIPTNVISITDGQIFLNNDLFHSGQRPAIDVGISVSRVGGAAQIPAMKQVSGRLRIDLAQYRELLSFTQFGADVDEETLHIINRGNSLMRVLRQGQHQPISVEDQILRLFIAQEGYLDAIPDKDFKEKLDEILAYLDETLPANMISGWKNRQKLAEEDRKLIKEELDRFFATEKKADELCKET
jgi:F-type H+-transporting ATPase subunit alpha